MRKKKKKTAKFSPQIGAILNLAPKFRLSSFPRFSLHSFTLLPPSIHAILRFSPQKSAKFCHSFTPPLLPPSLPDYFAPIFCLTPSISHPAFLLPSRLRHRQQLRTHQRQQPTGTIVFISNPLTPSSSLATHRHHCPSRCCIYEIVEDLFDLIEACITPLRHWVAGTFTMFVGLSMAESRKYSLLIPLLRVSITEVPNLLALAGKGYYESSGAKVLEDDMIETYDNDFLLLQPNLVSDEVIALLPDSESSFTP
ncbi:PREDICTED: uncharacterized protein LOC109176753 [Ipomoea nil]|uniref:uncharacterized protein LOC109176753 n=1 Tax=Ipomoea nil TaxID=35883 RepID=UPI0009015B5F|nr:PREDICTED: uncharacterized protein LOC109176753 [Ipomoea nil]